MDRVGRYELLEKLGEGGMGVVYEAYDPLIQRVVAGKLISAARTDEPSLRERFFAEARAAGRLSHRNIVTVYDLGEERGQPFFAMEFLEGRDMARLIRSREPLTLSRKVDLMAQAARGLAYAHAREVIHRDVKPANIFVTVNGDVKVLDFGLARLARPIPSALTRTKPFLGTVGYMAPEQVRGEVADARTDLFAFGVVFYELLSGGRPAFETDSFASTLHRILTEAPAPLAELDRSLPIELLRIVERALAKSRDERYQRVDDLLADLTAFRATLTAGPTRMLAQGAQCPSPPSGGELAGIDSLAVTVGAEAAVGALTPLPRSEAASSSHATPRPDTPAPAFPPRLAPRRARAWIASGLIGGGLLAAAVFRDAAPWQWWRQPTPTVVVGAPVANAATTTGTSGAGVASTAPAAREGSPANSPPPGPPAVPPVPKEVSRPTGGDKAAQRDEAAQSAAQTALAEAARARGRAEAARADRLAPAPFADGLRAERSAETLFRAGAFDRARSAYGTAGSLFDRAESEAREEQRREEEGVRRDARAPAPPASSSSVGPVPPAAPPQVAPPPAPSVTAPAPGTPTATAGGTLGTSNTGTPSTSTPSTSSTSSTTSEVLSLLSRYVAALEARSLERLKRVWPALSGTQEEAIAEEFRHARSISVALSQPEIELSGATARVACRRMYRLETQDGQRLETGTNTVFLLRLAADGWVIENVRHEAAR